MPALSNSTPDIDCYEIYLLCDCHDLDHLMRLLYWIDTTKDGSKEICFLELEAVLNHYLPWYKRVYKALLYILGKAGKDHYFNVVLRKNDVIQLKSFIDNMLEQDANFAKEAAKKSTQKSTKEFVEESEKKSNT